MRQPPDSNLVSIILSILPAICIALFGGLVRMMLRGENGDFNAKQAITDLFVAGFVGMIVGLILYEYDISPAIHGAVVGVSGAYARTIMELLKNWVVKMLRGTVGG